MVAVAVVQARATVPAVEVLATQGTPKAHVIAAGLTRASRELSAGTQVTTQVTVVEQGAAVLARLLALLLASTAPVESVHHCLDVRVSAIVT